MPMCLPNGNVNRSALMLTSQLAKDKNMHLETKAPARPAILPMCSFSDGNLLHVIVMNTKLSTPNTISKNKSVTRLIHASGVVKIEKSKCYFLLFAKFDISYNLLNDTIKRRNVIVNAIYLYVF